MYVGKKTILKKTVFIISFLRYSIILTLSETAGLSLPILIFASNTSKIGIIFRGPT